MEIIEAPTGRPQPRQTENSELGGFQRDWGINLIFDKVWEISTIERKEGIVTFRPSKQIRCPLICLWSNKHLSPRGHEGFEQTQPRFLYGGFLDTWIVDAGIKPLTKIFLKKTPKSVTYPHIERSSHLVARCPRTASKMTLCIHMKISTAPDVPKNSPS